MPVVDPTTGRIDVRDEAPFLPDSLEELTALRADLVTLIASGTLDEELAKPSSADSMANAIVGWLIGKANEQPDNTSNVTRAKYRKILAALALSVGLVVAGTAAGAAGPGQSAEAAAAEAPSPERGTERCGRSGCSRPATRMATAMRLGEFQLSAWCDAHQFPAWAWPREWGHYGEGCSVVYGPLPAPRPAEDEGED